MNTIQKKGMAYELTLGQAAAWIFSILSFAVGVLHMIIVYVGLNDDNWADSRKGLAVGFAICFLLIAIFLSMIARWIGAQGREGKKLIKLRINWGYAPGVVIGAVIYLLLLRPLLF